MRNNVPLFTKTVHSTFGPLVMAVADVDNISFNLMNGKHLVIHGVLFDRAIIWCKNNPSGWMEGWNVHDFYLSRVDHKDASMSARSKLRNYCLDYIKKWHNAYPAEVKQALDIVAHNKLAALYEQRERRLQDIRVLQGEIAELEQQICQQEPITPNPERDQVVSDIIAEHAS